MTDSISPATAEAIATAEALATVRYAQVPSRLLYEARAHLMCALGQAAPTDDAVIIGHVRDALALLQLIEVSP